MGDYVSSGEVRKLEGEVSRKQKNCTYQKERERITCLRWRMGDAYIKWRKKKTVKRIKKKTKKAEEKIE